LALTNHGVNSAPHFVPHELAACVSRVSDGP